MTRSEGLWSLPWRRLGVWLLVGLLVGIFVLDVALPGIVLLPFMCVPVVAAATFAGPRTTGLLAAMALALGLISGETNGDVPSQDYWLRLAGLAVVAAIAVYLAHLSSSRERRLAEGEQQYRLLAENATDVVFLMDSEWVIQWASPTVSTQFGYTRDELLGRARLKFVHFEDRRLVVAAQLRAVSGQLERHEERFALKSGDYRWMDVAIRPFLGEGGQMMGYIAALRDIDQEIQVRQALGRSERTFRLAMDGAAEGMAVVGLHRRFLEVNHGLCRLIGREPEWLSERDEEDVLHPDDVEPARQVRDRLLGGRGDHETRPCRLIHADGSIVWVIHAVGLLRDDDGLPLFFVCQYQDIAESQRVQVAKTAHPAVKTDAHGRRSDR